MNTLKKIVLVLLLPTYAQILYTMQEQVKHDPLQRMLYVAAFDQENIYKAHSAILAREGCYENVCPEDNGFQRDQLIFIAPAAKKKFKSACLAQLQSARRGSILRDAKESLVRIFIMGIAILILSETIGTDSVGGSMGIAMAIFDALRNSPPLISGGYDLIFSPNNPLEHLEDTFALNKCYIPRSLWSKITTEFMNARSNFFTSQKNQLFLEFALACTIFEPCHLPTFFGTEEDLVTALDEKINQFFRDYEPENPQELMQYKKTVWQLKYMGAQFIKALLNEDAPDPRYVHIHGIGGIGKTYFVRLLSTVINELLGNIVLCEEVTVTSSAELQGDEQQPGIFLKTLKNKLQAKKRGSIVFFDEAAWLNRPDLIDAAKRTFDMGSPCINAPYFGKATDGESIKMPKPPMLVIMASNEEINDAALRTRFMRISWPLPKKQILAAHAMQYAYTLGYIIDLDKALKWIEEKSITNFRDAEAGIVSYIAVEMKQDDNDYPDILN